MTRASSSRTVWSVVPADDATVRALAAGLGISPVTARVLTSRGLTDIESADRFMSPSLDRDWSAPDLIPGMSEVADRVAQAVRANERMLVFGDFDLDGISSAAVTSIGLRAMGANVSATVPHRFKEGYGLTGASIERIVGLSPDLVITVDCGISSAAEIALLAERGIETVVTDHHEPGEGVPVGPVANPKLQSDAPFSEFAGAGVALKLVQAVGDRLGHPEVWRSLTDLAMLGTIADVVPLVSENRALVADGLERTRRSPRPGVAALAAVAGVDIETLAADRVAFALAPRLNAAGRMADPAQALELLVTEDAARAEELANALDEHNRLRQAAEGDLMDVALIEAERSFKEGDRVLVLAGEGWHEGVRGIVASRLVARFGVPALLFCIENSEAQGSGRSVEGVDLFEAVSTLSGMLTRFGGHAAAVGVTLPAASLDAFKEGLTRFVVQAPSEAFVPRLSIDAEVSLDALGVELAAEFERLEPFGHGNRSPVLASAGVFMSGKRRVGKNAEHLRFTAYDGVAALPGIFFRCPDIERLMDAETAVDIAFELLRDAWRGVERVQLRAVGITEHPQPADGPAAELIDDLFKRADEILARGEYAGIGEAEAFHTKLAGVTFEGRQGAISRLVSGTPLRLQHQPDNEYDPNACALFDAFGDQIGFFNRRLAAAFVPFVEAGVEYDVTVTEVTGGGDGESFGVNVLVSRRGMAEDDAEQVEFGRQRRKALRVLGPEELDAELKRAFIGDRTLHRAQSEALDHLAHGRNTLVVMATGRGKSLIFHIHAAREAILRDRASIFVYPLRALVADQAFHLTDTFAELGVSVRVINGETTPGARDEVFSTLGDGSLDVVLTTPEFLDHHARRFAEAGRIGFLVVDEAHHVGLSRAGHRPVYARLDRAIEILEGPTVLAVTATAGDEVADTIVSTLGIERIVADPTVRENLDVEDRRRCEDKVAYVASLAATGEKVIVYVNSRETTVSLARRLRAKVPGLLHRVAFYNGGLTRSVRYAVEHAFRDGEISVVVSTSAFGEGVNIPDVRHVVLYHMPFNDVEFNQMSGRAGRDGKASYVHVVYSAKDARINRMILESVTPERDDLAALYLTLKDIAADGASIEVTNAEIAERVKKRRPKTKLGDKGVSAGVGVFRELGLVETEGTGAYRRLALLPVPEMRLELGSSTRYAEGREELVEFDGFRDWALEADAGMLLQAFNRPILPKQHLGDLE
ncbi:MAG: single-stranded-DNA-specific exonuclease RecJ [Coriobacteriia bacterium]|nr:single-stranded-DNA-specific exonuclease RecJ [Coriobacteriia bacterium]